MSPLEQAEQIKWLAVASGFIGMISASVCIAAYFVQRADVNRLEQEQQISLNMPPPRTQRMQGLLQGYLKQLMWLNVADFFTGLSFAVGAGSDFAGFAGHLHGSSPSALCQGQAVIVAVAPLFSAAWTLALAIELWRITFRLEQDLAGNFQRRRYILYQVLCWGLPVVLLLCTVYLSGVNSPHRPEAQDTGSWCWLDVKENTTDEGVYDPVWPLYVPKLLVALLLAGLYTAVVCRVRCASQYQQTSGSAPGQQGGKWNTLLLHFAAYPLVFIVTVLPPLLLRTSWGQTHHIQRQQGDHIEHGVITYGWLAYLTAMLLPAQGTFNLLLFASSNRQVRFALRRLCCCRCRCWGNAGTLSRGRRHPSSSGAQLTERASGTDKNTWLLGQSGGQYSGIGVDRGDRHVSLFGSSELDTAQEQLAAALLPSDDEADFSVGGTGGGNSSDEERLGPRRGVQGGSRSSSVNMSVSGASKHVRQTSVQYGDAAAEGGFVWEQGTTQPQQSWAASASSGLQGLPPSLEAAMVAYGRDSADSFDLPLPNTMTDGSVFESAYEARNAQ